MGRPAVVKKEKAPKKGLLNRLRGAVGVVKSGFRGTGTISSLDITEEEECFNREEREDGVYFVLNKSLPLKRRKEISCFIPSEFPEHHIPGKNGKLPGKWTIPKGGQRSFEETKDGSHFCFCYLDHPQVIDLGLLPLLVRKQEIVLTPGFKKLLDSFRPTEQKGTSDFAMGMTISMGGGKHCVGLSPIARGGPIRKKNREQHPLVIEYLRLCDEICRISLEYAIPEKALKMHEKQNIISASMTRGGLGRGRMITSTQLNSTDTTDIKLTGIGRFGKFHIDAGDDKKCPTVMDILSHVEEGTYPGNFLLPGLKVVVPCKPLTVFIFQGSMPHVSMGLGPYDVPEDSPLRLRVPADIPRPSHERWQRITNPMYPTKGLLRPSFIPKDDVLSTAAVNAHWHTEENKRTWEMCFYIKKNEELKEQKSGKEPAKKGKAPKKAPKKSADESADEPEDELEDEPEDEQAEEPKGKGKPNAEIFDIVDGVKVQRRMLLPESYEKLNPEEVTKLFPWVDEETKQIRYPSVETARICLQGQAEIDPEWEAAIKITTDCCFGYATTDEVREHRRKQREDHARRVAPWIELGRKFRTKYRTYEEMGIVVPVSKAQEPRIIGKNALGRGTLRADYKEAYKNGTLDRETRKLANKAMALGEVMNQQELMERKERWLYPPTDYDNAVIVLEEKFIGLSI